MESNQSIENNKTLKLNTKNTLYIGCAFFSILMSLVRKPWPRILGSATRSNAMPIAIVPVNHPHVKIAFSNQHSFISLRAMTRT